MAGSKPTAVHFTLIFFVMLSLFLGVFAYMTYSEQGALEASLAEARTSNQENEAAFRNQLAEKQALINAMGYPFEAVGSSEEPNTVLGELNAHVKALGITPLPPQQATIREVFNTLNADIIGKTEVASQAQAGEQSSRTTFETQRQQQEQDVVQARADQQAAEASLRQLETEFQEQVARIRAEADQWQDEYRKMLAEYDSLKNEFDDARQEWRKVQGELVNTIKYQRDQIAQLENISFEVPDGEVSLVDNTLGTVWINRGSLDYLRPQVTFSVYTKDHRGIARSTADVKAKIEVVRVENRSAECRILEEDLTRPIAPGDPIYSPLWQSGRVEKIAFVGIIDLDGDGKSDPELLKEIMDVNNAKIQLRVTDEGLRTPPEAKLDVDTKFLVVGEIPDPTQFSGLDERVKEIELMMEELHKLAGSGELDEPGEAEKYGVQVVSLNEFLTWVGYRNQQRVYRPGENRPYNLSSGSRSAAVDEVHSDRTSGGRVSEVFRNKRIRVGQ